MNEPSELFLASTESLAFREPFRSTIEANLADKVRNDYWLVSIEPPAVHALTKNLINRVVIAGFKRPLSFDALPLSVYIAVLKNNDAVGTKGITVMDIEVVSTGDLFGSLREASELSQSLA